MEQHKDSKLLKSTKPYILAEKRKLIMQKCSTYILILWFIKYQKWSSSPSTVHTQIMRQMLCNLSVFTYLLTKNWFLVTKYFFLLNKNISLSMSYSNKHTERKAGSKDSEDPISIPPGCTCFPA